MPLLPAGLLLLSHEGSVASRRLNAVKNTNTHQVNAVMNLVNSKFKNLKQSKLKENAGKLKNAGKMRES